MGTPSRLAEYLPFSFRVLYRVFLLRLIDLELLSADGDPSRLMCQFAAVFFSFSFFCTFPVPYLIVTRWPIPVPAAFMFEHFLIETSMTIAGLIAVLGWDSTFPDRRDMLVLGPLPVRSHTLFFAKIAASLAGPAIAVIMFNLCTGFGWPMVFAVGLGHSFSLLRTLPAYWFTILSAGAFMVLSILALQGLAANLLPRQIFLRISGILQASLLSLLLCSYLLGPSLNSPAALAAPQNQRILHWLPAYWFLGLFNQLNGSMHAPLIPLAHRAWIALALSAVASAAALLLCYFRTLPAIVEQPDILPAVQSPLVFYGNSLRGVMALFCMRTLLRSRRHRMILSIYVGLGVTAVVGLVHLGFTAVPHANAKISIVGLLITTLTMILAVIGLRMVAAIPILLPANWIIRTTQHRPALDYHRAVRFSWIALAVVPVLLLSSVILFRASMLEVLEHLLLLLLLGIILVELCLLGFRKIPFACSYLPGKANLHFVFWIVLLIFLRLLAEATLSESRILQDPLAATELLLVLTAIATALWRFNLARAHKLEHLLFDESSEPDLVTLKLR